MASSSPPPHSLHRICIIMSPVGRFLQCRDCQLSYTFPDGVEYATLASLHYSSTLESDRTVVGIEDEMQAVRQFWGIGQVQEG
jgi:hypothetical protein